MSESSTRSLFKFQKEPEAIADAVASKADACEKLEKVKLNIREKRREIKDAKFMDDHPEVGLAINELRKRECALREETLKLKQQQQALLPKPEPVKPAPVPSKPESKPAPAAPAPLPPKSKPASAPPPVVSVKANALGKWF